PNCLLNTTRRACAKRKSRTHWAWQKSQWSRNSTRLGCPGGQTSASPVIMSKAGWIERFWLDESAFLAGRHEKNGAPAWDREPRRHVSSPVSFSHRMRGVIHPSFPLRGRWERPVKSVLGKPLPPRLASFSRP